jgi:hypothetical protein
MTFSGETSPELLKEKDTEIQELRQTVAKLENKLNELSIQAKKQQL